MNPFEGDPLDRHFPALRGLCYLNAAGEGPLPRCAVEAIARAAAEKERPAAIGRAQYETLPATVRGQLARLISAAPEEIALTGSTSAGIATVAREFPFHAGGEVLLCEGQFPSNVLPWKAAERRGAVLRRVALRHGENPADALERAATERTAIVSVDWIGFDTGVVADLDRIGALCRRVGAVFVLDAAQGAGVLRLDVRRSGVQIVAAPGHKWLLGPPGTGFLYLSRQLADGFHPWNAGWMHIALRKGFARLSELDTNDVPPEAERIESGTPSWLVLAGWNASLDLLESIGVDAVERHVTGIADRFREASRRAGLEVLSPAGSPLVVAHAGTATRAVHRALTESGVVTALRGGIRIAPHVYNTESDVVRFETAVRLAMSGAVSGPS